MHLYMQRSKRLLRSNQPRKWHECYMHLGSVNMHLGGVNMQYAGKPVEYKNELTYVNTKYSTTANAKMHHANNSNKHTQTFIILQIHQPVQLLVFSVTPFKIDQNKKSKPFNILSLESGNRKKVDMQRLSPRFRSQQFFLWEICRETFSPNL